MGTGGDGVVNWKVTCQGVTQTGQTIFTPPLDEAGTQSFRYAGTSRFNSEARSDRPFA